MTDIECPLSVAARRQPEGVACRSRFGSTTYTQLERLVGGAVSTLLNLGVGSGDRIALLLPNSVEAIAYLFAAPRLGASSVMLNLRLLSQDWRLLYQQAGCKLLVTDKEHNRRLEGTWMRVCAVEQLRMPDQKTADDRYGNRTRTKLCGNAENTLVFTSGSSGKPKGAVLTNTNHYYSALGSNLNLKLTHNDCWLLSLPLYHVGGLAIPYRVFLSGAVVHITAKFVADQVIELVQRGRVTHLSLVPTMLEQLLPSWQRKPPPPTLKAVLLGGAAASDDLIEQIRYLRLPVLTTYGLTEAASQVCSMSPKDDLDKLRTSGRPLAYRRLRVVDDSQRSLDAGEIGQIAVGGEVLCAGYLSGKSVVAESGEWHLTGDLGYLDENGYLVVKGRIDEMIVSGGENIFPSEIICAASTFPGIKVCAVIGVSDETWGERPVLFVEMEPGQTLSKAALRRRLEQKLARYKLPQRILVVPQMPRTAIGKIDRDFLKSLYRQSRAN